MPQVDNANPVTGPSYYVGLACNPITEAPSGDAIAIIQRGACAFTTKAQNAEAAGYQAGIVFNHSTGCNASVSMLVKAGIRMLFVPRPSGFDLLGIAGYDPSNCDGSGTDFGDAQLASFGINSQGNDIDISADFDRLGIFARTQ